MEQAIRAALSPDYPWADRFHYFDTIDSTNNFLKRQALLGAPHGTVAVADCQTGGKGRLGRSFQSPGGVGIYLSMLLRPECPAEQLMHLTCAVGTAMCDAVEASAGFRPGIKWTNDLVWEKRKLSGILVELLNDTNGKLCVVIGIGVNCCQRPEDFPEELRTGPGLWPWSREGNRPPQSCRRHDGGSGQDGQKSFSPARKPSLPGTAGTA